MPRPLRLARRPLRRVLPLVTSALLIVGCEGGTGGSQTAEFPKMGPPPSTSAKKPDATKKMDRVGSEAGLPNS